MLPATLPAPDVGEAEARTSRWQRVTDGLRPAERADLWLALAISLFLVATWRAPRDPDLYWHRVIGETLLHSWWHAGAPDPVSYSPGQPWYPGAWVFEVSYAGLIDRWGYGSILVLRFILCLLFPLGLAAVLRWRRPGWVAAAVFALVALPMTAYMQDRPQTLSFILLLPVAVMLCNGLRGSPGPRWWWLALYTWVWANLHGYWVFVPVTCVLLALAVVLDRGHDGVRPALEWFGKAMAATIAAAFTPFLWHALLIPLRLSNNTALISEWEPTTLKVMESWAPAALLGLIVLAWARSRARIPRGTIFVVLALSVFAAMAIRNTSVAAILVAPIVADAVIAWRPVAREPRPISPWWPAGIVATGAVAAAAVYTTIPLLPTDFPVAITQRLSDTTAPLHVLTDYNTSGFVRGLGGSQVRVAVDGRVDRYGGATLQRYMDMTQGKPGWKTTFRNYAPQVVVLDNSDVLTQWLQRGLHWRVAMRDGDYVMLLPPHSSLESTLS